MAENAHPPGDPLYCYVCSVPFSSPDNKKQHELGKKHKRQVVLKGGGESAAAANSAAAGNAVLAQGLSAGSVSPEFHCVPCNMFFSSYSQHVEHSHGKKHARRAVEAGCPIAPLEWLPDQEEQRKRAKLGLEPGNTPVGSGKKKKGKKKNQEEKYFARLPPKMQRNLTAYACKWLPLIEMELQEEMGEAIRKLNEYPAQRLINDGVTIVDVMVQKHRVHKDYFKKTPGEQCFKISLAGQQQGHYGGGGLTPDLPNNDIMPGDVVWLSNDGLVPKRQDNSWGGGYDQNGGGGQYGGSNDYYGGDGGQGGGAGGDDSNAGFGDIVTTKRYLEGHCISRNRQSIVLTIDPDTQPNGLYDESLSNGDIRVLAYHPKRLFDGLGFGYGWRVDKGISRIAYDRMKEAIEKFVGMKYEGHSIVREIVSRIKATVLINPMDEPLPDEPEKSTEIVVKDEATGKTAIIKPVEIDGAVGAQATSTSMSAVGQAAAAAFNVTSAMDSAAAGWEPKNRLQDWFETATEEGYPYYYNTKTQEVTWTKPTQMQDANANPAMDPASELLKQQQPGDMTFDSETNKVHCSFLDSVKENLKDQPLNESQVSAVTDCLQQRLSLIQGPPGTGKTTTAVHLLASWVKGTGRGPILAAAYSNVAVDQMMYGLLQQGIKAVRIGNPNKVNELLKARTLDELVSNHPKGAQVKQEVEFAKQLANDSQSMQGKEFNVARKELSKAWKRVRQLEGELQHAVLSEADVVCATCIGTGNPAVQSMSYPLVVVDECTQSTEPACLIPLVLATEHCVLIGDHCQLPPTLMSDKLKKTQLQTSLFERMIAPEGGTHDVEATYLKIQRRTDMGVIPSLLKVQYRMHPMISHWPNHSFYGGNLIDGVVAEARIPPVGLPWVRNKPCLFLQCRQQEDGTRGTTKSNSAEAALVKQCVINLIAGGGVEASEIGVITPYSGQVVALRKMFDLDRKGRGGGRYFRGLEVNSVDGYQGREKEVIIFSCVRSNASGAVGFLSDVRRLNVALTRAKRGLVVVGNPDTLSMNPTWNSYVTWANQCGLMVQSNQISQQQFAPPAQTQSYYGGGGSSASYGQSGGYDYDTRDSGRSDGRDSGQGNSYGSGSGSNVYSGDTGGYNYNQQPQPTNDYNPNTNYNPAPASSDYNPAPVEYNAAPAYNNAAPAYSNAAPAYSNAAPTYSNAAPSYPTNSYAADASGGGAVSYDYNNQYAPSSSSGGYYNN